MSSTADRLPLGIRQNNPGNLRAGFGLNKRVNVLNDFAAFDSMADGLQSLFALIGAYYREHGLITLPRFIARYAPASENDLAAYTAAMCQRLCINPLKAGTEDLRLNNPVRAMLFARALISVEQGAPPTSWLHSPEWFSLSMYVNAMAAANGWAAV